MFEKVEKTSEIERLRQHALQHIIVPERVMHDRLEALWTAWFSYGGDSANKYALLKVHDAEGKTLSAVFPKRFTHEDLSRSRDLTRAGILYKAFAIASQVPDTRLYQLHGVYPNDSGEVIFLHTAAPVYLLKLGKQYGLLDFNHEWLNRNQKEQYGHFLQDYTNTFSVRMK